MQLRAESREAFAPPAVAKGDRDSQDLWPEPTRNAIEVPDDLRKEIVGIELLDRRLHQRTRPLERGRMCRELTHGTGAQLRPPPIGVKLLLGANGVFEVFVDVDRQRADRMHGYTSSETARRLARGLRWAGRVP
jgi:hypothetical protein